MEKKTSISSSNNFTKINNKYSISSKNDNLSRKISDNKKTYYTPRNCNLKKNFSQKVLELENELLSDKNIEIVNQLFQLYKEGAEFYAMTNNTLLHKEYLFKLQKMIISDELTDMLKSERKTKIVGSINPQSDNHGNRLVRHNTMNRKIDKCNNSFDNDIGSNKNKFSKMITLNTPDKSENNMYNSFNMD